MFENITKFANEATTNINDRINSADVTERVTDSFTTTSDQVLDAVLDVNRRVVDAAVSTADRFADQVKVEFPFADRFPTPAETGERYLEFVERAVSLNRDMNQRVVEMIKADNAKAATDKVTARAKSVADTASKTVTDAAKSVTGTAKSATRTTKKTAAKKRPAKKAAAKKRPAKKVTAKKAAASK